MNGLIVVLVDRLNTGWQLIDQEPDPRRRDQLERHWIHLLHEYERAVDRQHESVTPWGMSNPMAEAA
jgi:hypothetical protein